MTKENPCQLYLISPPRFEIDAFAARLEEALSAGGVGAFQLRLKQNSPLADGRTTYDIEADDYVRDIAKRLKPICHAHQVAFLLNDSPRLARDCKADGVHLGQEDGTIEEAREILGPDAVIGVSCHDSRHLAMEAGEAGADYIAFGAFHPTTSKTPEALAKYGTPTMELLSWWGENVTVPCVAIGGMTPENCAPYVAAGADFIAAITAVWDAPEGPRAAVGRFVEAIRTAEA